MDELINKLTHLNIKYECINCQKLVNTAFTLEYIDTYNNLCIDYYCENCSKNLFLTSSPLWTPFLITSPSP